MKEDRFPRFSVKVTGFSFTFSSQALRSACPTSDRRAYGAWCEIVRYKETTDLFFSSSGTAGVSVQSARSLM